MLYYIRIPASVKKEIKKVPLPWKERVIKVIQRLSYDPNMGVRLKGQYQGYRKIKVWPYRIIYKVNYQNSIIDIVEVRHRGSIFYD
jgi:addiction module RelE/StbE family toxin